MDYKADRKTGIRRRVPLVMQMEAQECGSACLTMILAHYGKWLPLELVRKDCDVSRDGSNAENILKAARQYGMDAYGVKCEPQALRRAGKFPCIAHWDLNHFIVVCGFHGRKVRINDPARGIIDISEEEFDECFTGIALMLSPTEDFVTTEKRHTVIRFIKSRLKNAQSSLLIVLFSGIMAAILNAIDPAFSRVFLDRLLVGKDKAWIPWFFLLLIGVSILQIVLNAVTVHAHYRINGKMTIVGNSSYIWKILHLPLEFFSQRMAGDIQDRQESNAQASATLIYTLAPMLLNTAMMVVYFIIMLRYSVLLSLIGLASVFINAMSSMLISRRRLNYSGGLMRDNAALNSYTLSGIEMINTIKAAGAEQGFFAKWSGYHARLNARKAKYNKENLLFNIFPKVAVSFASSAVLIVGTLLAMRGEFTVGMIIAFQGFLSAFMSPALLLVNSGQTLQEMKTQIDRVDDVMNYPEDHPFSAEEPQGEARKLKGKIELKNVTFGYAKLADPVIRNFDLTIEPGSAVAIVGASGCGKSTISRLLSGLYQPWEGEILYDGKPLSEIPKMLFNSSVAVVDQDITLFEGSVEDNIKMWDRSIEDFEMILAARDASLHADIQTRTGGYRAAVTEDGRNFSGGQRQRMEIARVLAQDPTVIILDEATSALDAITESRVTRSFKERDITSIIIAHRLSTVRECDEICVMRDGVIIGKGNHEELMESCPYYKELIMTA